MKYLILFCVVFASIINLSLASALSITINIPERYSEVSAGESLYFETEVKYPENTIRKDLRIEYFIKNPQGEEIAYLKVLKAIETQATFMDNINIPENAENGIYKLSAKINDYEVLNEEVSATFNVAKKPIDKIIKYMIICFIVIAFIASIIIVELFMLITRKSKRV